MQPKHFSDFAKEDKVMDGQKVKLDSILNKEILVLAYRLRESKYSKKSSPICLTIQFELDGSHHVIFTGSTVLSDQIEKYKDEIPFLAKIVKIDRYYSFA